MNKPTVIVLAAGTSSRMGSENKLLLDYRGLPLIKHTVSAIIAAEPQELIVVTGFEEQLVTQALAGLRMKTVYNPDFQKGMTSSIQAGVQQASGNGYMICLGDMYAISSDQYRSMMDFFQMQLQQDEQCICLPAYRETKGNPVIFSAAYRDEILRNTDPEGCKSIVQQNRSHVKHIEFTSDHILKDVDTPEEYRSIS